MSTTTATPRQRSTEEDSSSIQSPDSPSSEDIVPPFLFEPQQQQVPPPPHHEDGNPNAKRHNNNSQMDSSRQHTSSSNSSVEIEAHHCTSAPPVIPVSSAMSTSSSAAPEDWRDKSEQQHRSRYVLPSHSPVETVINAVLDARPSDDASTSSSNPTAPQKSNKTASIFTGCATAFMLVPSDEHFAVSQQQQQQQQQQQESAPSTRRVKYPMIPMAHCRASQLLASFEESFAQGVGVPFDADESDERGGGGGGGPQIIPIAVQGICPSVLNLVAAYIVHFSGCDVNETTTTPGGEHVPAAAKLPTKIPTPYPPKLTTFTGGSTFEDDIFGRCDKDLSFCIGVMHAANFLGVSGLVPLASLSLALKLRGKAPNDFRKIFAACHVPQAPPVVDEYGDAK
ncbi:Hypothetical protein, putative [Bodo saltans]|uniref:Uncharacterized protein n=1 Tax=Bodo saltans TaxID=75058 RepID=A0A0S4IYT5_BODSA|nr:Hypothetical protein, putative [Bodo saltans]|eukprot:CUG11595.1 Hypothetical protein, putative [Bodo saltans]